MVNKVLILFLLMQLSSFALSKPKSSTSMEHIVYMVKMQGSPRSIEAKHVHTLASALGSEAAARKAIIYDYKNTINGFSAILSEQQVQALSKQPGVLKILPTPIYPLPQDLETPFP